MGGQIAVELLDGRISFVGVAGCGHEKKPFDLRIDAGMFAMPGAARRQPMNAREVIEGR